MGLNESKMVPSAAMKPEPAIKKTQVSHLIDPRSPSACVNRTPIQVCGLVSKTSAEEELSDPRSPYVGVMRTPVSNVMRVTVGSFAHRLSMLFHGEVEGKAPENPQTHHAEEENVSKGEELASTEPLLTPQPPRKFGPLAEHANLLATPVPPPLQSLGDSNPFVLLKEPQVEVEAETEADISLEEAEEARESPLHKRLSMSLLTCHEGATSSQIFAEVHRESTSSPEPSVEAEPPRDGVDHSYALPSLIVKPETPVELSLASEVQASPTQPEEADKLPSSEELVKESSLPPASSPSEPPTVLSPEQPQGCTGIRCPTFDSKSPSQVVFKPQWLGKGFGTSGLRARGVKGYRGKGGSPLAVCVVAKNATNENKGQSGKLKQKGTEGRSPLQFLKETNSPRRSQMKLKVSTPDKQRLGQMDRQVLAVSLDKENR
ncbi:cell division cycle-associated protein 3 [Brachyistius frenatus]|uniref:cell division cycle-associated protein 3 n=1 Tax=Brachyistius frenatus TaxID=100188 RepID=UPI0037E90A87